MRGGGAAAVMAACVATAMLIIPSEFWQRYGFATQCKRSSDDEKGSAVTQPGAITSILQDALKNADLSPRVLSTDPFVIVFDSFASELECDELVQIFTDHGDHQGSEIGVACGSNASRLPPAMFDPRSSFIINAFDSRTPAANAGTRSIRRSIRASSSFWCDVPGCHQSPQVQRVQERLANLTRSSDKHAEVLQLIRYNQGEEYTMHHDFTGPADLGAAGGRVFSFVLFLSTPAAGGDLAFTDLNFSVPATKGAAVLWPSVMNEDPELPELLTHHASRPVVEGQKLAAVTWVHAYDWRTLHMERKCESDVDPRRLEPPLALLPRYMQTREQAGLEWKVPVSLVEKAKAAAAAQAPVAPSGTSPSSAADKTPRIHQWVQRMLPSRR